jgi:hypothetical protein
MSKSNALTVVIKTQSDTDIRRTNFSVFSASIATKHSMKGQARLLPD